MTAPKHHILFALATLTAISACRPERATSQHQVDGIQAARLWSIEVMEGGVPVKKVEICADASVRGSFTRPMPEIGGEPCLKSNDPIQHNGQWFARCRADGATYRVSATATGDPAKDFTVDMTATRHDRHGPIYQQVRRYRLIGACPPGWRIGEMAGAGDKQVLDTLTGKRRPIPPTGG